MKIGSHWYIKLLFTPEFRQQQAMKYMVMNDASSKSNNGRFEWFLALKAVISDAMCQVRLQEFMISLEIQQKDIKGSEPRIYIME